MSNGDAPYFGWWGYPWLYCLKSYTIYGKCDHIYAKYNVNISYQQGLRRVSTWWAVSIMCREWLVDEEYNISHRHGWWTWSIMYRTSMADGQGVLITSVAGGLRERRLIGMWLLLYFYHCDKVCETSSFGLNTSWIAISTCLVHARWTAPVPVTNLMRLSMYTAFILDGGTYHTLGGTLKGWLTQSTWWTDEVPLWKVICCFCWFPMCCWFCCCLMNLLTERPTKSSYEEFRVIDI